MFQRTARSKRRNAVSSSSLVSGVLENSDYTRFGRGRRFPCAIASRILMRDSLLTTWLGVVGTISDVLMVES